jgi:GT2 family glycosyltransferase
MRSNIAIIILNYKNYSLTISCLKNIVENNENATLIVVDNYSENQSLEKIKNAFPTVSSVLINEEDIYRINIINRLVLIQGKNNYGYARGNNIGIKFVLKGNFEYIVVLNNDIIVNNDIFNKMSNYVDNVSSDYVLFGPLLYDNNGNIEYNCARKKLSFTDLLMFSPLGDKLRSIFCRKHQKNYDYKNNHPQDVDLISGSFMFFRRVVFDNIDGFDSNTFLYFEEAILCKKIHDSGHKIMFLPMFDAIHLHGATTAIVTNSKIFRANETYKSLVYYLNNYSGFSLWEKIIILIFYKISILLLTIKLMLIK